LNGEENSPLLSEISGKTYLLEQNELSLKSLSFNFEARLNEVRLIAEQGEHIIQVGFGNRERGTLGSPYVTSDLVAVDGAWTAPDTYSMNLIYYETPESVKFTFRFEEDYLLWDTERKASFGPSYPVQVKGILK
jgi:hypothetical protein